MTLIPNVQNPFDLFDTWFQEAQTIPDLKYPNVMCLSTVDPNGLPEGRQVLLKEQNSKGFVFYTNTHSAKGLSLASHPHAALTFHWEKIKKQIRIQGTVHKTSSQEADVYFETRPRISQLGAWASFQSEFLDKHETLETRLKDLEKKYHNQPVPRPPHWGGYCVEPLKIEFWLEGPFRLHDRLLFTRETLNHSWTSQRLNP